MMPDFEFLAHTGDIKLRIYGSSLEELFTHALIGMFQVIGPKAEGCYKKNDRIYCDQLTVRREVSVEGIDLAILLVDFLSDALCLSDTYNEAYLDVQDISVGSSNVYAVLIGVPIIGYEHVEIKAVTYHDLRLEKIDGIWQADVVFDI